MAGFARTDFAAELIASDAAWRIAPTQRAAPDVANPDSRATTHIDYFHCRAALAATSLTVSVATAREPVNYLMTISMRAFRIDAVRGAAATPRLVVPPISQQTAPRALRYRICSPTSVAMVLAYHGIDASLAPSCASVCMNHRAFSGYGRWRFERPPTRA
jgi:hypothetical protein